MGGCAPGVPPLDPPMKLAWKFLFREFLWSLFITGNVRASLLINVHRSSSLNTMCTFLGSLQATQPMKWILPSRQCTLPEICCRGHETWPRLYRNWPRVCLKKYKESGFSFDEMDKETFSVQCYSMEAYLMFHTLYCRPSPNLSNWKLRTQTV